MNASTLCIETHFGPSQRHLEPTVLRQGRQASAGEATTFNRVRTDVCEVTIIGEGSRTRGLAILSFVARMIYDEPIREAR